MAANAINRTGKITVGLAVGLLAPLVFFGIFVPAQKPIQSDLQIKKCWEYRSEGTGDLQLVADQNSVYTVRDSSVIQAVATSDGSLLWSLDVGGNIGSNLVAAESSVVLVRRPSTDAGSGATLISLSASTGVTRWTATLPDLRDDVMLSSTGDNVLAVSTSGAIASVDARDGRVIWSRKGPSEIKAEPFLAGSSLYFASDDRTVGLVSLDGVLSTAIAAAPFRLTALARSQDGSIVAGDERGRITSYSGTAKKVEWQFTSGAAISALLLKDGTVIAASNDNFVYALSPNSGGRIWKRRLAGRVQAIRLVGEDGLLVEMVGEKTIQLLDTATGKTAGQITFQPDETPLSMTPVSNDMISVRTDAAVYLFSVIGCPQKQ